MEVDKEGQRRRTAFHEAAHCCAAWWFSLRPRRFNRPDDSDARSRVRRSQHRSRAARGGRGDGARLTGPSPLTPGCLRRRPSCSARASSPSSAPSSSVLSLRRSHHQPIRSNDSGTSGACGSNSSTGTRAPMRRAKSRPVTQSSLRTSSTPIAAARLAHLPAGLFAVFPAAGVMTTDEAHRLALHIAVLAVVIAGNWRRLAAATVAEFGRRNIARDGCFLVSSICTRHSTKLRRSARA